jgi:murein DD-endopeptidase MepM/ murein hydrolase activator NlpD
MPKKYRAGFILFLVSFLAIPRVSAQTFLDVKLSDWFYVYVEEGVQKGYIDDSVQNYRSADLLNRAELAKLAVTAFHIPVPALTGSSFQDVPQNEWYFPYIETLTKNKIISGYEDDLGNPTGYFGPEDPVTREQAAKIIVLAAAFTFNNAGSPHFPDVSPGMWSYDYVETLKNLSIIDGYSDQTFKPKKNINRAEIAKIFSRALLQNPSSEPTPAPIPDPETDQVINAFKTIRTEPVFPAQGKTIEDIESTFGPRFKDGIYDWHRGIDIDAEIGTPVLAMMDGQLVKTDFTESGGNAVYIRHKFPSLISFMGRNIEYYYTLYLHLDTIAPELVLADKNGETPIIKKGRQIGTAGSTGTTTTEHLHIDLRIGTYCTLEFQLQNPNSSCAKGFLFDPHVHPMFLFPPLTPDMQLNLEGTPLKTQDTKIHFTSPQNQPLLNRIEYQLINSSNNQVITSHVLDLNKRTGYDASTNPKLDTVDKTKPYLSPLKFVESSTIYATDIVIPTVFVQNASGNKSILTVTDIWGNSKTIEWNW